MPRIVPNAAKMEPAALLPAGHNAAPARNAVAIWDAECTGGILVIQLFSCPGIVMGRHQKKTFFVNGEMLHASNTARR
jgi:hypothetical protein